MTRDQLLQHALKMSVGDRWEVDRRTMQAAFGRRGILAGTRTPEDDFLDQLPGADYGAWTCKQDVITGAYRIARHREQARRVREDGGSR